jgi:hypothetical protein
MLQAFILDTRGDMVEHGLVISLLAVAAVVCDAGTGAATEIAQ